MRRLAREVTIETNYSKEDDENDTETGCGEVLADLRIYPASMIDFADQVR